MTLLRRITARRALAGRTSRTSAEDAGVALVEYGLIVAFIALATAGAVAATGQANAAVLSCVSTLGARC